MNYLGSLCNFLNSFSWQKRAFIALSFCLVGCTNNSEQLRFSLLSSKETGVTFINQLNPSPQLNILNYIYYYNGGGVAAGDFNNDGLIDLYFTANQAQDGFYLNQGDFKFNSVISKSGIDNAYGWTTGVTTVDVNQDGLLDIYISKVSGLNGQEASNLLYVNQGNNQDGIPQFKEQASAYGLDFKGFSTQAAFFDYDKDGDLDLYLLNHNIQPNSNYGKGSKRYTADLLSGDRLYQNNNGLYTDVTQAAGILQSGIGYGLGLAISDLNNDSYPDIYVGNDFFENDYLYINQKDGTFVEQISSVNNPLGHTTHYSMGNDVADVNNDGFTDIISMDMLPEDVPTYKSSGVEFGYQTYSNYLRNGYEPQYMQNTLHLNQGKLRFGETANLSGIAATEWSWSPLIADFNNDGLNDLYITNGILGATNDMDFINFIADQNIQKALSDGMGDAEMEFISKIPQKKTANYLFKNQGDNQFKNVQKTWAELPPSYSNGAVYADLDNDGHLDLAVNNVNQEAFVYRNNTVQTDSTNYLKLQFKGPKNNIQGIGAKVILHAGANQYVKENYLTRGFLSSVPAQVHFGLAQQATLDSLKVAWPNGEIQTLINPEINQLLTINYKPKTQVSSTANQQSDTPSILFDHKENTSLSFNRNPLIPYANSNLGPAIAVADVNQDGLADVFMGGAKGQASSLMFQQNDGTFISIQEELFKKETLSEAVDAVFFDANNDTALDLIVVNGGDEFNTGAPIQPQLYLNKQGTLVKDSLAFKNVFINASTVKVIDFNKDGNQDLIIGSLGRATEFGSQGAHYIFSNNGKGKFTDVTQQVAPELEQLDMISDLTITDLNQDSWPDLVVIGHWQPIQVFLNKEGILMQQENESLANSFGLWNTIKAADFDLDGDIDFVVGNWGLNTRLQANSKNPVRLYLNDFNNNGSTETLVTYVMQGQEIPLPSKDELSKQLPGINKKYLSYKDFAQGSLQDIFGAEMLNTAQKKQVNNLASIFLENLGNGSFNISSLPFGAQISQVNDIFVEDLNADGYPDFILLGNNHHLSTQLSRSDALHGAVFLNNKNAGFQLAPELDLGILGVVRNTRKITIQGQPYLLIGLNNQAAQVVDIPFKATHK